MNYMSLLLLLLTTTIVISEDVPHGDSALILNGTQPAINIKCLCIDDTVCDGSGTCKLSHPDHRCYESWRLRADEESVHVNAGCVYNEYLFMTIFCAANNSNNYIVCCSHRDYCNDLDAYSQEIRQKLLADHRQLTTKPTNQSKTSGKWIAIALTVLGAVILISSALSCLFYRHGRNDKDSLKNKKMVVYNSGVTSKNLIRRFIHWLRSRDVDDIPPGETLNELLGDYSTSSMGNTLPMLIQRTLAREITLGEKIGAGRYGCVYRGTWRADNVAVKIFSSNDERSWFREIDIYETNCLRHENILGYIAADNKDAFTHTQLWLVTEYHENGSVYDYLMNHTITVPILVKMMLSIASGLCHLHMPIDSTNGKVGLAHRDLKTKNILVKKDLTCCIADLGLAVKEVRVTHKSRSLWENGKNTDQKHVAIDIQANPRAGTHRYMAPEVLDATINMQSFESFKAADMYALGLAFWEILRRCQMNPTENDAEVYQVPYEDMVPNIPSIEQLKDIVCDKKIRPAISPRWTTHPAINSIVRICQELWIEEPTCRLNSLNVKTQLKVLYEMVENELSNMNEASQQQSAQNGGPWTA